MKQFQKRYIYSSILASTFFIISFTLLHVHIIISIVLTFIIQFGGVFLFKKDDIRELTDDNINTYLYYASKLHHQAKITKSEKIINNVEEIATLTNNIIISLKQRSKKV